MRQVPASQLLDLWEAARHWSRTERALQLLTLLTGTPRDRLELLTIGEHDALLFSVRARMFGQSMPCVVTCTNCGEQLEFMLNVNELLHAPSMRNTVLSANAGPLRLEFRLPDSRDVAAISSLSDPAEATTLLASRCLLNPVDEISEDVLTAMSGAMEEADPNGDLQLDLSCADCGNRWTALLDPVSYFWTELQAWAHRTLSEVHVLASSYGWSESHILAMSAWRRRFYLDEVGA